MKQLSGSYSLAIMIDDLLMAVRDPYGFKPLCIGTIEFGVRGRIGKCSH